MNIKIIFKDGDNVIYEGFDSAQKYYNKRINKDCVRIITEDTMFWYAIDEVKEILVYGEV